jgi:hypothetical protein
MAPGEHLWESLAMSQTLTNLWGNRINALLAVAILVAGSPLLLQAAPKHRTVELVPIVEQIAPVDGQLEASVMIRSALKNHVLVARAEGVAMDVFRPANESCPRNANPSLGLSVDALEFELAGLRVTIEPICLKVTSYGDKGGLLFWTAYMLCEGSTFSGLLAGDAWPPGTGPNQQQFEALFAEFAEMFNATFEQLGSATIESVTRLPGSPLRLTLRFELPATSIMVNGNTVEIGGCDGINAPTEPFVFRIEAQRGAGQLGNEIIRLWERGRLSIGSTSLEEMIEMLGRTGPN